VSARRPAVCIVRQHYYPDNHIRRNAETLVRAGLDVSVIALRRPHQPARESINGVRVYRLPVEHRRGTILRYVWEYGAFFILSLLTVAILHARKGFRVVEVDNMPDVLVFSALVPKLTGAKVILGIFDNMPELLMLVRRVGPRHPLVLTLAWLERLSTRFADRVVVTQELARQLAMRRGVPGEKVTVVLNGPDESIFDPQLRERTGQRDDFTIVTHGLILERFGIQTLLDALPAVASHVPEVRVEIYGDGEYRAALEAQAARNGVADRVHFHGWLPLDEIPARVCNADVGFVGMLCDLMLSNKLMEYVALGVPVALARWPTYEHYYSDDDVRYFQPGDTSDLAAALLDIWRKPDAARARAERAAALYLDYRWAVQREVYLGLYADLAPWSGSWQGERHLTSTP
jgi:glycosyltransferase involved in cell wall biosynthesis